jgi:hypothetical protein
VLFPSSHGNMWDWGTRVDDAADSGGRYAIRSTCTVCGSVCSNGAMPSSHSALALEQFALIINMILLLSPVKLSQRIINNNLNFLTPAIYIRGSSFSKKLKLINNNNPPSIIIHVCLLYLKIVLLFTNDDFLQCKLCDRPYFLSKSQIRKYILHPAVRKQKCRLVKNSSETNFSLPNL